MAGQHNAIFVPVSTLVSLWLVYVKVGDRDGESANVYEVVKCFLRAVPQPDVFDIFSTVIWGSGEKFLPGARRQAFFRPSEEASA